MNIRERLLELYGFDTDHIEERLAKFYQSEVNIVGGDEYGTYICRLQPDAVPWFENAFYDQQSFMHGMGETRYIYQPDGHEIHIMTTRLGTMVDRSGGPVTAVLRTMVQLASQYHFYLNPPPPPPPPVDVTFQLY